MIASCVTLWEGAVQRITKILSPTLKIPLMTALSSINIGIVVKGF